MAAAADPAWIEQALAVLQQSQAPLLPLLARHGCRACTDVTGFGLLGHLGEMIAASPAARVALDWAAVPALPGALELLAAGVASSLAPANATALALLDDAVQLEGPGPHGLEPAHRALLIDPQTCGPLLAALPASNAAAALQELRAAGFGAAALIGRVLA
jgi:selenide, water dikinase